MYQFNNVICFINNVFRFFGRKIAPIFLPLDNILKALEFNDGYLVPIIFQ
ncbi:hypothetical protein [Methanosarcina barkeri]|nr:hypothetical protein [Methanosarcina barkeri]